MTLYQIVQNVLGIQDGVLSEASHGGNTPNWDSLRQTEMIFAVESAYRVRFTGAEIMTVRTVGDLRGLLRAKGVAPERLGQCVDGKRDGLMAIQPQAHRLSA